MYNVAIAKDLASLGVESTHSRHTTTWYGHQVTSITYAAFQYEINKLGRHVAEEILTEVDKDKQVKAMVVRVQRTLSVLNPEWGRLFMAFLVNLKNFPQEVQKLAQPSKLQTFLNGLKFEEDIHPDILVPALYAMYMGYEYDIIASKRCPLVYNTLVEVGWLPNTDSMWPNASVCGVSYMTSGFGYRYKVHHPTIMMYKHSTCITCCSIADWSLCCIRMYICIYINAFSFGKNTFELISWFDL